MVGTQDVTPPAVNTVRPGSLLAAANTPIDPLVRFPLSTAYVAPYPCGPGWRTLAVQCDADQVVGTNNGYSVGADIVYGWPFEVQVARQCSTLSVRSADEYTAWVQNHLAAIESAAIAREFWTGELALAAGTGTGQLAERASFLSRNSTATVLNGGAATDARTGFSQLQQALGEMLNGEPGAIHTTRRVIGFVNPAGLRRDGNNLLDLYDNRVITDAGYATVGPGQTAPVAGQAWVYGTARPTIRRSATVVNPPNLGEALNRGSNTITYTAEKAVSISLACGVIAVKITLP